VWNLVVWWRWWRWIGFQLMVRLIEWRLLPLILLGKDLDGVLELCEAHSLSVYVLHSSLIVLSCGLPASDGFLFLVKALNLLLNPS
jgi:hypothetical protein